MPTIPPFRLMAVAAATVRKKRCRKKCSAGADIHRTRESQIFQFKLEEAERRAALQIPGESSSGRNQDLGVNNPLRMQRRGCGGIRRQRKSCALTDESRSCMRGKRTDGTKAGDPILVVRLGPPNGAHMRSAFFAACGDIRRDRSRRQNGENRHSDKKQAEQDCGKAPHSTNEPTRTTLPRQDPLNWQTRVRIAGSKFAGDNVSLVSPRRTASRTGAIEFPIAVTSARFMK
jgi:hypothetical protein